MPIPDATQIGRLSAQVEGLHEDVREMRDGREQAERRLRDVETAVKLMLQAQSDARRSEERQYRRIEVRLQVLTIAAAVTGIIVPLALVLIHH